MHLKDNHMIALDRNWFRFMIRCVLTSRGGFRYVEADYRDSSKRSPFMICATLVDKHAGITNFPCPTELTVAFERRFADRYEFFDSRLGFLPAGLATADKQGQYLTAGEDDGRRIVNGALA